MKRLLILLIGIITLAGMAEAQNWLQTLVNELSNRNDVDRTIAVNRSPTTHEITNATYDFRFSSSSLYKSIMSKMKKHAEEADFYSEENANCKDKQKLILMRFTDNGRRWSCRLQPDDKNKQFLVAVTSSDKISGNTNIIIGNCSNSNSSAKSQKSKKSRKSTVTTTQSYDNARELEELKSELKKAEQERKRKLGR